MGKPRKCRVCKDAYQPMNSLQKVCSPSCAIALVEEDKVKKARKLAKERRKEIRERKQALKSKSQWLNEAQAVFNRWIVYRDRDKPCISCGTMKPDIQYCAGHYKTRGAHPELRFDEDNVHKQCNQNCNLKLSGNIMRYRPNLIDRIGQDRVDRLEGSHEPKHYTIEDAKQIKAEYQRRLKEAKT